VNIIEAVVPAADSTARTTDELLLPEGTRLLHIGPHKTGTTALQAAFHLARERAAEQGVRYASHGRQPVTAVLAGIGRGGSRSADGKPPNPRHWRLLLAGIRRSRARRVLLSSEFFADAEQDAIKRIVNDLDPSRVHVAVTLRPLARIMPSQWQQYVQNRLTTPFEEWLDAVLNQPRGAVTPTFWQRHRHDELVQRWAGAVGPSNVTVIVLDDEDRTMIFRVFEDLLGLSRGTLVADPELTNRSLSRAEIEVIRTFNAAYRDAGLPLGLYERIVRSGAAPWLARRAPDAREGRLVLPKWAIEPVGAIARSMVTAIAQSGVRIVGDLDSLAWTPDPAESPPDATITPDVAASAMLGIVVASGLARSAAEPSQVPAREPAELLRVSTPQLLLVLWRRGRAAIRRRIRRLFGRG
jgi:hypothetical protein